MDKKLLTLKFDTPPDVVSTNRISRSYDTKQNPVEHWHNRYELFIILEGYCTFFVQNTLFHMEKGDICIVNPNCNHAMSYPNSFQEHLVINFSDMYIEPTLADDLKSVISTGKYTPKTEDLDFFKENLDEICMYSDSKEKYSPLYLKTYFDRLFIKMLRTKEQFNNEVKTDSLSVDIARVLEYININYTLDITLEQAADLCHVSSSYFSKYFKKTIGMRFKEYLTYIRLNAAKDLLLETNYSISEVASEIGYDDSNYFSFVFSKHFGIPPLKYRKITLHNK